MFRPRHLLAVLALAACLGSSGCTLVKPVVGVVTGPVVMLAGGLAGSNGCFCGCDGRGIAAALVIMSAIGAAGGLVTGVISDVQVLCGCAENPTANWADPFATNTSPEH